MYKYSIFGLKVLSELQLAGYEYDGEDYDVRIIEGDISNSINKTIIDRRMKTVLTIPEIAKFFIQNGKLIVVEREKSSKDVDVHLFLLGSAFSILMLQRDIYCLHGSTFHTMNKSYTIVGDSGVGKSSFMAGMSEKGYKIMTDDVTRIIEDDGIYVSSSYPTQKVWKNIAEKFNVSLVDSQELTYRNNKFVVAEKDRFINIIAKLDTIIELKTYDGDLVYMDKLEKSEAFSTIIRHTYRPEYLQCCGDKVRHFMVMANVAKNTNVFRLYRPLTGITVHEQNNLVISQLLRNEII